jgi:hypothetical protein
MSDNPKLYEEACRIRDTEQISATEACKRVGMNPGTFGYYAKKARQGALVPAKRRAVSLGSAVSIPFGFVPRGKTNRVNISGSPEELAAFLVAMGKATQ